MAVRHVALVHSSMREGVNAKGRGKLHTVYQVLRQVRVRVRVRVIGEYHGGCEWRAEGC